MPNYASPRLSAPVVSAYTLLVPLWVILNDFVFFKIAPNMNMIMGAMLIAFGLSDFNLQELSNYLEIN